uniref:Uncharacterized protein n=1 Tax=viral metagenome TaxID=1070528 RepID=A0A6C0JJY2_9ZZZZ
MSQSNAAAIKRRVNVPSTPSQNSIGIKTNNTVGPSNVTNTVTPSPTGFTLPQVIAVIDSRLTTLEKNMRDGVSVSNGNNIDLEQTVSVSDFSNVVDEFNSRFAMFAEEISEMKDIVIKLQSYTMEVNKTLMDERIHVFSDLNLNESSTIGPVPVTNEPSTVFISDEVVNQTSVDLKNLIQTEVLQSSSS